MKLDPEWAAFPVPENPSWNGMNMRTHIATQLLAGMLASPHDFNNTNDGMTVADSRANNAVRHADALIRRLNAEG